MAKSRSLASMSVEALLQLREDIGKVLSERADELRSQLSRLGAGAAGDGRKRGVSVMKGRKVAPKYRDPETGETWAGRGARPRWLVARLKAGKKIGDFAIGQTAKSGRKKRRAKK
jgi:DNA-binding protein H-NS